MDASYPFKWVFEGFRLQPVEKGELKMPEYLKLGILTLLIIPMLTLSITSVATPLPVAYAQPTGWTHESFKIELAS